MKSTLVSILVIFVMISLVIFIVKCSGYNYPVAVLTQDGFDFSAGISDIENPENNDGLITRWCPGGSHPDYPSQSAYLWFSTAVTPNKTRDMGEVELNTIRDVSGLVWDTLPPPLLVGHCVVIGCKNGYAKIKVNATTTSIPWRAYVNYYYSDTTHFDH